MDDNYIEISKEDIENIGAILDTKFSIYQLKNSQFSIDSFKNGSDVVLLQSVADKEFELVFKTKEENGKYFISLNFEIIKDNILNPQEGDVFHFVSEYFHDVIDNEDKDFSEEKESLINFLILTEEYDEEKLKNDLDPSRIREDYKKDHDMIYGDDSLSRVQKSLALKELVHMSICQVIDDIDLFFTRPFDLTPEEEEEKNKQEAKSLENELKLY